MSVGAPFYPVGQHWGIDLPGARAVFTTRRGGASPPPYDSLNLGALTDDDPAAVAANRSAIAAQLGVSPSYTRQVHGPRVLRVGEPLPVDGPPEADGQAAAVAGVAPAVLVADCLPVVIAGQGAVAAVHAGWRGLAQGVLSEGVSAVRELGGTGPLAAAIGPGAGPCCYEAGDEVHAAFAHHGPLARARRNADLKSIARAELAAAGVEVVYDLGICTICADPQLLYSHRRDHGITGRQAGIAWLS